MAGVKRFLMEEQGADAAEYTLVISLVSLAVVGGAILLGGTLSNAFNSESNCFAKATGANPATC